MKYVLILDNDDTLVNSHQVLYGFGYQINNGLVNMIAKLIQEGHEVEVVMTTHQDLATIQGRLNPIDVGTTDACKKTLVWNAGEQLNTSVNQKLAQNKKNKLKVNYSLQADIYPRNNEGKPWGYGVTTPLLKENVENYKPNSFKRDMFESETLVGRITKYSSDYTKPFLDKYGPHTAQNKQTQIAMILGEISRNSVEPTTVMYIDDTKDNVLSKNSFLKENEIKDQIAKDEQWLRDFEEGSHDLLVTELLSYKEDRDKVIEGAKASRRARINLLKNAIGIDADPTGLRFVALHCPTEDNSALGTKLHVAYDTAIELTINGVYNMDDGALVKALESNEPKATRQRLALSTDTSGTSAPVYALPLQAREKWQALCVNLNNIKQMIPNFYIITDKWHNAFATYFEKPPTLETKAEFWNSYLFGLFYIDPDELRDNREMFENNSTNILNTIADQPAFLKDLLTEFNKIAIDYVIPYRKREEANGVTTPVEERKRKEFVEAYNKVLEKAYQAAKPSNVDVGTLHQIFESTRNFIVKKFTGVGAKFDVPPFKFEQRQTSQLAHTEHPANIPELPPQPVTTTSTTTSNVKQSGRGADQSLTAAEPVVNKVTVNVPDTQAAPKHVPTQEKTFDDKLNDLFKILEEQLTIISNIEVEDAFKKNKKPTNKESAATWDDIEKFTKTLDEKRLELYTHLVEKNAEKRELITQDRPNVFSTLYSDYLKRIYEYNDAVAEQFKIGQSPYKDKLFKQITCEINKIEKAINTITEKLGAFETENYLPEQPAPVTAPALKFPKQEEAPLPAPKVEQAISSGAAARAQRVEPVRPYLNELKQLMQDDKLPAKVRRMLNKLSGELESLFGDYSSSNDSSNDKIRGEYLASDFSEKVKNYPTIRLGVLLENPEISQLLDNIQAYVDKESGQSKTKLSQSVIDPSLSVIEPALELVDEFDRFLPKGRFEGQERKHYNRIIRLESELSKLLTDYAKNTENKNDFHAAFTKIMSDYSEDIKVWPPNPTNAGDTANNRAEFEKVLLGIQKFVVDQTGSEVAPLPPYQGILPVQPTSTSRISTSTRPAPPSVQPVENNEEPEYNAIIEQIKKIPKLDEPLLNDRIDTLITTLRNIGKLYFTDKSISGTVFDEKYRDAVGLSIAAIGGLLYNNQENKKIFQQLKEIVRRVSKVQSIYPNNDSYEKAYKSHLLMKAAFKAPPTQATKLQPTQTSIPPSQKTVETPRTNPSPVTPTTGTHPSGTNAAGSGPKTPSPAQPVVPDARIDEYKKIIHEIDSKWQSTPGGLDDLQLNEEVKRLITGLRGLINAIPNNFAREYTQQLGMHGAAVGALIKNGYESFFRRLVNNVYENAPAFRTIYPISNYVEFYEKYKADKASALADQAAAAPQSPTQIPTQTKQPGQQPQENPSPVNSTTAIPPSGTNAAGGGPITPSPVGTSSYASMLSHMPGTSGLSAQQKRSPTPPVLSQGRQPQTGVQENRLQLIKDAVSKAKTLYSNWSLWVNKKAILNDAKVKADPEYRGAKGQYSMFRHNARGRKNANELFDLIDKAKNEQDAIKLIGEFLIKRSTNYNRHSFSSFLLDQLKGKVKDKELFWNNIEASPSQPGQKGFADSAGLYSKDDVKSAYNNRANESEQQRTPRPGSGV